MRFYKDPHANCIAILAEDAETPDGLHRNVPTPEGAAMGEHLARFVDGELVSLLQRYPNHVQPCSTCAFRRGTLPNQCPATVMDALKCVMEGVQFCCHEKQNAGRACAGWFILWSTRGHDRDMKVSWPFSYGETPNNQR